MCANTRSHRTKRTVEFPEKAGGCVWKSLTSRLSDTIMRVSTERGALHNRRQPDAGTQNPGQQRGCICYIEATRTAEPR
jgi:hypothetical protein